MSVVEIRVGMQRVFCGQEEHSPAPPSASRGDGMTAPYGGDLGANDVRANRWQKRTHEAWLTQFTASALASASDRTPAPYHAEGASFATARVGARAR